MRYFPHTTLKREKEIVNDFKMREEYFKMREKEIEKEEKARTSSCKKYNYAFEEA